MHNPTLLPIDLRILQIKSGSFLSVTVFISRLREILFNSLDAWLGEIALLLSIKKSLD